MKRLVKLIKIKIIILNLLLGLVANIYAQNTNTIVPGNNLSERLAWLRAFAQSNGKYIVDVSTSEDFGKLNLEFSGKNNITLFIKGRGSGRVLTGSIFIDTNNSLYLDSITIKGPIEINKGKLTMENGSSITEGYVTINSGGSFTMNSGSINKSIARPSGVIITEGSVKINSGGSFVMNGGVITDNKTDRTAHGGAGVSVTGSFTMNAGEISNNVVRNSSRNYPSSGGVLISGDGIFNMNGGTIQNNRIDSSSYTSRKESLSGVYVIGTFNFKEGSITDGVIVSPYGTFNMSGGMISTNTTGVYIASYITYGKGLPVRIVKFNGKFNFSSGTIKGNKLGVFNSGIFMMTGGEIIANNHNGDGAGVSNNGTFVMNGGAISENTASGNGGGVYLHGDGNFEFINGTISKNTATNGGGIFVQGRGSMLGIGGRRTTTEGAIFKMTGGSIFGNIARENGGGVFVNGIFTKTGGSIIGYNTDQTEGNSVRNTSNIIQNFKGHSVYSATSNVTKLKESSAGAKDNLSFDGTKSPATSSGAWDN